MSAQPEALRLAALLNADEWPGSMTLVSYARECAAELRRLAIENQGLHAARTAYASEFAPDADGEHDTGSIHQNIRALKAECAQHRSQRDALLEALQAFVKYADDVNDDSPEFDRASAAIAKATGVEA